MIVAPPGGGLIGSSNYNLYGDCKPLTGVSLTVEITEEIISAPTLVHTSTGPTFTNEGIAFQLNCASPSGYEVGWQQYIFVVWWKTQQLRWWINNWNFNDTDSFHGGGLINIGTELGQLPTNVGGVYSTVPAGYRLKIELASGHGGKIDGAAFSVLDAKGARVSHESVSLLTGNFTDYYGKPISEEELAPIVDIDFVIVGYANGASSIVTSGAGSVTYEADRDLVVRNTYPECAEDPANTEEFSNITYGELDSAPSRRIVQSFGHRRFLQPRPPWLDPPLDR
jgi:hypothetical protein